MDTRELTEIVKQLGLDDNIQLTDIPNIDLYMDQLITLFEAKLQHTKRCEEDKLLTKTMINNYTKDKLLMPAIKKKYTKHHIILMLLIYDMKQILSINDIKQLLSGIVDDKLEEEKLEKIYLAYLECKKLEKEYFDIGLEKRLETIKEQIEKVGEENSKELEIMLLVQSFIIQASYHKRIAEKLIDYMVESK
ncbi:MAG: DUF1836 domain-containing protein [Cellulosilyticaceae bacterium]